MADVFVSYTQSDRDWAHWIAREVEAIGHTAHLHEWEIRGSEFVQWMADRLAQADAVVCIASDDYLAAKFCQKELSAAYRHDREDFCRIVKVRDCKIPLLYDGLNRCDLTDRFEQAASREVRAFLGDLKGAAPSATGTSPTVPYPGRLPGNITLAEPMHFKGRDQALADLADALRLYPGRVTAAALIGMPGAGKSTVAATYAFRNQHRYRIGWWIRAASEATIREDLAALGISLGWVKPEERDGVEVGALLDRLARQGRDILLVFDNAYDPALLSRYLPTAGQAHVIVTSNAPHWGNIVPAKLDIRLWPPEVGAEFLVVRIPAPNERQKALEVSTAFEGLPLALEMAASYCEELGVSLDAYLRIYENSLHPLDHGSPRGYSRSVKTAFDLALEEAAKRNPAARTLIQYCALLAPDPIPLSVFARSGEALDEPLRSSLVGTGLNTAIAALRSFGLLLDRPQIKDERYPEIVTDCLRLHRLVRAIVASGIPESVQQTMRGDLIVAIEAVYPQDDGQIRESWPLARRLDAHAMELVGGTGKTVAPPTGREVVASRLIEKLAAFRSASLEEFDLAQALLERAHTLRTALLPADHFEIAKVLNSQALLYWSRRDFGKARNLAEDAIAMMERLGLGNNPEIGWALVNLARIVRDIGDLDSALKYCQRALALYEICPDGLEIQIAFAKTCFGRILVGKHESDKAMPFFDEAMRIYSKIYGTFHPSQAASLLNVASVLIDQAKLKEARQAIERAQHIYSVVSGPESGGHVHCLAVLATVHLAEKKVRAACQLLAESLALSIRVFGPDHEITRARQRQVAFYEKRLKKSRRTSPRCGTEPPPFSHSLNDRNLA